MFKLKLPINSSNDEETVDMDEFTAKFFNSFLNTLNSNLSDYRSAAQHTGRESLEKMTENMLYDLDALYMTMRGFRFYKYLRLCKLKQELLEKEIENFNLIADQLNFAFENAKVAFMPELRFNAALRSFLYPKKLLFAEPKNTIENYDFNNSLKSDDISNNKGSEDGFMLSQLKNTLPEESIINKKSTFDEIQRLIKIYLLKEDINEYEIEEGILILKSKFLTFKLSLCGEFKDPQWKLIGVQSTFENRELELYLIQRIPPNISVIQKFINFYENRLLALEIFDNLTDREGYYKDFSGKMNGYSVQGKLISKGDYDLVLNVEKDSYINQSWAFLAEKYQKKESSDAFKQSKPFAPEKFGENYHFSVNEYFVCFNKNQNNMYIGLYKTMKYYKFFLGFQDKDYGYNLSSVDGFREVCQSKESNNVARIFATLKEVDSTKFYNSINSILVPEGKIIVNEGFRILKRNFKSYYEIIESFMSVHYSIIPEIFQSMEFGMLEKVDNNLFLKNCIYTCDKNFIFNHSNKVKCNSLICFVGYLRLLKAQLQINNGYVPFFEQGQVLTSEIGQNLVINFDGLNVIFDPNLTVSNNYLNEDIRNLQFKDKITFITLFYKLYLNNLFPSSTHTNMIVYNFEFLGKGNFFIYKKEENFVLEHNFPNLPTLISKIDANILQFLQRCYTLNRFNYLKSFYMPKNSEKFSFKVKNFEFSLTKEGIKLYGDDFEIDKKYEVLLSNTRDIKGLLCNSYKEIVELVTKIK